MRSPLRRIGTAARLLLLPLIATSCIGVWYPVRAQDEIFIPNSNNSSITVYERGAGGNAAPLRTLMGGATGLNFPWSVSVDPTNDEIFVANNNNFANAITVYARTARGNAPPLRTVSGPDTHLSQSRVVIVDTAHDELIVMNSTNTILAFSRTARGDAIPVRTLSGDATGLKDPQDMVLDTVNDEILVANPVAVTVYPRKASGNMPPLRTIAGASTGLAGANALDVDPVHNEIFVADTANDSITVYSRTADGDGKPLRVLSGPTTGLSMVEGLVIDEVNDEVIVTNSGNGIPSVTVYDRAAKGDAAPLRTLTGARTEMSFPRGLAVSGVHAAGKGAPAAKKTSAS